MPYAIEVCDCAATAILLRRNRKSPVLCPICHIVRSQWDEPLAAARPHDLGVCCLRPADLNSDEAAVRSRNVAATQNFLDRLRDAGHDPDEVFASSVGGGAPSRKVR
jgi:type VI protein secretion system component VasF